MNNTMPDKCELLMKITEFGFALNDLNLYLDTHPQDSEALMYFHSLDDNYQKLRVEYAHRFGPLNFTQVTSDNYYTWISTPWPWEGGV